MLTVMAPTLGRMISTRPRSTSTNLYGPTTNREDEMQGHFEINVALNGHHLFATAERSCTTTAQAEKVYAEIVKRFPSTPGFKFQISVTRHDDSHIDHTGLFAQKLKA